LFHFVKPQCDYAVLTQVQVHVPLVRVVCASEWNICSYSYKRKHL